MPATFEILAVLAEEIPQLRDEIAQQLGASLGEHKEMLPDHRGARQLERLLEALAMPVSPRDALFAELARSIVVLRQPLLLVIGAGFSYDTMPVTAELEPLLVGFLKRHGIHDPIRMIREQDQEMWQLVRDQSDDFKARFAGWSDHARLELQHHEVPSMLSGGQLCQVVSFNWDDLIERAGEKTDAPVNVVSRDGILPERASLWKLHGDVRDLDGAWVFPYDTGRVFDSLLESLEQTVAQTPPSHALIVGYSEYEQVVRERLIGWITDHVPRVIRVRPNLAETVADGVASTARDFFRALRVYRDLQQRRAAS